MIIFSNRLSLFYEKNQTQEELATEIGVTRKTINTIENSKFVPLTILAIRLARFYKIRVEVLFELTEKKY